MKRLLTLLACLVSLQLLAAAPLPEIVVTHDDTLIDRSCVLVIPPGTVIPDPNTNGVVHVVADNLTVRFRPGSTLRGSAPGTPWDTLRGIGIRIDGHRRVRIEDARIHGYFCGLVATHADRLTVDGGDFSDNYRQRLRSTPEAEDAADWLYPHHNDERKWRDEYGGAVCIETSDRVTVRGIRVRRGQNGILLDRVNRAAIYDNDCSFLSGWGLALWRSSDNVIARNALDFCVRGHVEGVYNRGQDSAGILCFEQCNRNLFAENSVTHGGDGFFGFAGREAIGETWMNTERARLRQESGQADAEPPTPLPRPVLERFRNLGCNDNLLWNNDFSYAAAHGVELTFSEGNRLVGNRFVENAICGFWGGYSSQTVVLSNLFEANGGMAYGLERGAINMEHASDNLILHNRFRNNRCGIHLWWDDDGPLLRLPGVAANLRGVSGNCIADNAFVVDSTHPFSRIGAESPILLLHLRDAGSGNIRDNSWLDNYVQLAVPEARQLSIPPGASLATNGAIPRTAVTRPKSPGSSRPVGARPQLRGRHQILLDEWGPWDHESPLVRAARSEPGTHRFDLLGFTVKPAVQRVRGTATARLEPARNAGAWQLTLTAPPGVTPYHFQLNSGTDSHNLSGTLINATWRATFFPWSDQTDPRQDLAAWRALATTSAALSIALPNLSLPYGMGGPRDLQLSETLTRSGPGPDHFGMIARTRLHLPAGPWQFTVRSDDGVRLSVNGAPLIENWTWHGPTTDAATLSHPADGEVEILIEHFEIDGYAVLELRLDPA